LPVHAAVLQRDDHCNARSKDLSQAGCKTVEIASVS
jgi:hypothetical protein